MNLLHVALLMFLYSLIWIGPVTIYFNRRKKGLKPYWLLFLGVVAMEIALVYLILLALQPAEDDFYYLYIPPILATAIACAIYFKTCKYLDSRLNE